MLEIKKKEGESSGALFFRFSKKVRQSGILKEVRKRRFKARAGNRLKRRLSAIHRDSKKKEVVRLKKLGLA